MVEEPLGIGVTFAVRQKTGNLPFRLSDHNITETLGEEGSFFENIGYIPEGSLPPYVSKSDKYLSSSEDLNAKELKIGSGKQSHIILILLVGKMPKKILLS